MDELEETPERAALLRDAVTHYCGGGKHDEFGRALGYRDGAFVRQMIKGQRAVSEKTVQKVHKLRGMAGWFDRQQSENQTSRELSTNVVAAIPGKDGHTTTVKQALEGVKADPIKELPILSWGMIDRIGMPNKEIQGMTRIDLGFAANACWDPELDKVIQVPDTSLGPRFEMGDYLIMHPLAEGEAIEAGRLPVLVRLPDGTHALTPYNPLQAAINNLKVVAVCRQFFSPPPP